MRVLLIGSVWPEHRSSGAGVRAWSLIRALRALDCEVHFASQAKENDYSNQLIDSAVNVHTIQANDSSFDSWIKALNPSLVILDRFMTEEQFGWRIHEQVPLCVRVLDTIDLHFVRRARAAGKGSDFDGPDLLRELAAIYRSHRTWVVSSFEQFLLTEQFGVPAYLVERVSLGYEPLAAAVSEFEDRKNFVFIGNFRHPPNWDAVQHLSRELWPEMRKKMPNIELHVYGAYPSRAAMDLDNPKTGFRVFGQAPDQYQALRQYRVNLAPLRFGAGVKGKILDGWTQGTPCVGTATAAEGMTDAGGEKDWGGIVADRPQDWIEAAVQLYENELVWSHAQKAGFRILENQFSQREVQTRVQELLQTIQSGALLKNVGQNYVGQMLWQEQHLSKKYMSKWIEAKNS